MKKCIRFRLEKIYLIYNHKIKIDIVNLDGADPQQYIEVGPSEASEMRG